MVKNKEIVVREDTGHYIYDQQPIVHVNTNVSTWKFNLIYLIIGLISFGLVGSDIAYLTGVGVIVGTSVAVCMLVMRHTGDFWKSALAGGFFMAVILGTSIEDSIYGTLYQISSSLHNIAWVGIGAIVAIFITGFFRRGS